MEGFYPFSERMRAELRTHGCLERKLWLTLDSKDLGFFVTCEEESEKAGFILNVMG